jgi:ubiquinol-cytochrome c reductase cytochrome b subunit
MHFLLPFAILGLTALHITLLHEHGSSNPLGVCADDDCVSFYPYFFYKDLFGFSIYCFILSVLVFYYPNWLGHPDNYIPANPLVTPAHIVPEWYFLVFYAILRAVPSKLGGVILMGSSILILFFLPALYDPIILGPRFKPAFTIMFWLFIAHVL